jgi:hypothetical protein
MPHDPAPAPEGDSTRTQSNVSLVSVIISPNHPPLAHIIVVRLMAARRVVGLLRKDPLSSLLVNLGGAKMTGRWQRILYVRTLLDDVSLKIRQSYVVMTMPTSVTDSNGQYSCIFPLRPVYQAVA